MSNFNFREDINNVLTIIIEEKFKKKEMEDYLRKLRYYILDLNTKKEFTVEIINLLGNKNKKTREIATTLLDSIKEHSLSFSVRANEEHAKEIDKIVLDFKTDFDIKINHSYYIVENDLTNYSFRLVISHNRLHAESITSPELDSSSYKEVLENMMKDAVQRVINSKLTEDEVLNTLLELVKVKIYPEILDYCSKYRNYSDNKERFQDKIIALLENEDKNLREFAVTLLLRWQLPNNKELLEPLKNDKNKKVKKMVSDFLESLNMVFDVLSKETIHELIKQDEDNNNRKNKYSLAIHKVAAEGDLVGVKYLLKNGYKLTDNGYDKKRAIHLAVSSDNSKLVEFLLNNKSKVTQLDSKGNTPLHYISKHTPLETVKLLIANGADINAINKDINSYYASDYQRSVFFNVLLSANKDIIDFFIEKGVKLSEVDDIGKLLTYCEIDNFIFIMDYLKSIKHSFDDMSYFNIYRDIKDKKGTRSKILYEKYNILEKGGEVDILMEGDLEFIKMLDSKGFDFNGVIPSGTKNYFYPDLTPYLFIAFRNKKREVREFFLNNKNIDLSIHTGDREEFYFDMPDFYVITKYSSILTISLRYEKIEDIKSIVDNKIEDLSDIILAIAIEIYKNRKGKVLKFLIENYYDSFNPFRIVTKDEKDTLLSLLLKVYKRETETKNLLENSYIKEYRKNNNLSNNLEEISKHYLENLHNNLSTKIDDKMKNVKKIESIYEYLESGESDKIKAALKALKSNKDFYIQAERRYLNIIKAKLNNKDATLEDFEEGIFNKDDIRELEGSYFYSGGLDFALLDIKVAVDFISAITMNHVDVDKFITEAKKVSTDIVKVQDLQYEFSKGLFEGIENESKIYSDGWYSKLLNKLLSMKGNFAKMLFDKSEFNSKDYLFVEAFFFFIGRAAFDEIYMDIYQSNVELPDTIWLTTHLLDWSTQEAYIEIPKKPFVEKTENLTVIERMEKELAIKFEESSESFYDITKTGAYYKKEDDKIVGIAIVTSYISNFTILNELEDLKELTLKDCNITNLSYLKIKKIEKLNLEKNTIKSISFIKKFKNIKFLNLKANKTIKNLKILEKLTTLEELDLSWFEFDNINFLKDLKNLKKLRLVDSHINDISDLKNLKNLEILYLNFNEVTDISPLKDLKNLNTLYLDDNKISDITPLENLKELKTLSLNENKFVDLVYLKSLSKLEVLTFMKNEFKNLESLNNLNNLLKLNFSYSTFNTKDLDKLELKKLEVLISYGNNLTNISFVKKLVNLKELHLNKNKISNISGIENLKNLEELSLGDNKIVDISLLENLTNLKILHIYTNEINSIKPLKNLKNLEELYIFNNKGDWNQKMVKYNYKSLKESYEL